jgi:O-antigen/teichoic acid export membrane protein
VSDSPSRHITSGQGVARNTLWNLIGQIAPLVAAIFAIPVLIKGLGVDRFGLLSLAWMVIGYFSLFDLGLGRALVKMVAEKLGASLIDEIPELAWTALVLMGFLGIVGTGLTLALTNWLVTDMLKVPLDLQAETVASFRLLAWSVPIVILTTGLRGILEAYQRFDLVNLARVPLGILTFLCPVAALPLSNHLDVIVTVLLGLRILILVIHLYLCERVVPGLFRHYAYSRRHVRPMLGFGGWMTVTNVVGPLMVYIDRFIIGSLLGMAAVAYYVTPYEVITKMWVIPGALVGVLFPAFSACIAGDRAQMVGLFWRGVRWIFLALFPPILLVVVFASDGLRIWLSDDFSTNSTAVLQLLAAGVLINSLAHVPFAFIQGAGRPDLTAKLHLAELPFYLFVLWLFMNQWGLIGAAAAWSLRVGIDALAMFVISAWIERGLRQALKQEMLIVAVGLIVLGLGSFPVDIIVKSIFATVALTFFIVLSWRYLLSPDDRVLARKFLPRIANANKP